MREPTDNRSNRDKMVPHGQLRSSYDYGTNGTTSSYEKMFSSYDLGPITATNTDHIAGPFVPPQLRTANKSKSVGPI